LALPYAAAGPDFPSGAFIGRTQAGFRRTPNLSACLAAPMTRGRKAAVGRERTVHRSDLRGLTGRNPRRLSIGLPALTLAVEFRPAVDQRVHVDPPGVGVVAQRGDRHGIGYLAEDLDASDAPCDRVGASPSATLPMIA
jgi:hypothetical protein